MLQRNYELNYNQWYTLWLYSISSSRIVQTNDFPDMLMRNELSSDALRHYALQLGIGLLAVAAALLLSLLLRDLIAATPLLFFLVAVLVSTWYGGLFGGVFSVALSLLAASYFSFSPSLVFRGDPADFFRAAVLLLIVGTIYLLRRSRQQTLQELERSRDQLAIILRDAADGITVQDTSGKLTYANYEAARSMGFVSADALLKAPLTDVMKNFEIDDENGQPFPLQSLPGRLALLGMRYPEATIRFRNRTTGEERWSVIKARPVFDAKGNVLFAINLAQDITKAKTAEQLVFRQREQFRVTLESIGDGVIATDIRGAISFINPVAANLTGWREFEALGKPVGEVFHIMGEKTREPIANPLEQALREGRIVELSNHALLISRQGQEIPIQDSAAPIRDLTGALIGAVLVFRDVSAQRAAHAALEAREARYRSLVENASDMIYSLTMDGKVTSINAAGEALLGYARDEVVGLPVERFVAPEYLEIMEAMFRKKVAGSPETTYELELLTKDGGRRRFAINSRLMSDEHGEQGIFGIARLARSSPADAPVSP